jgi:LmbE family N-acetylglucosaminyl deacetylase
MRRDRLDTDGLERYESLFIAPHGDDVALGCPARVLGEVDRGRRVLVMALFEPVGSDTTAARAVRELGADYAAAGLPGAPARRTRRPPGTALAEVEPGDDEFVLEAARLLTETGPRTQAVHVFAPLGLGASIDHRLTYEASVRAFATEAGRNLFLYEERPEAFVPGAVRTRLALLGARLPPGAVKAAERAGLVRHLWRTNEPDRLRGTPRSIGFRLSALAAARGRFGLARPWNPARAYGPRLQPIVHLTDAEGQARAEAIVDLLLPRDAKGRPRAAKKFNARAHAAAKRLGGVYHAERFWLFLPSGDGLPEVQHPLERAEA